MTSSQSVPLRTVCVGIYDGPHATPKPAPEGPIYLGIGNITERGGLDLSDTTHVSPSDYERWTRRVTPQPGDLVFTYEATLHRYALIPEGFSGCLGRRVGLVRPDPSKVHPRYLLYHFLSRQWRSTVESWIMPGATVDRIPIERFPDFPITLPPLAEQQYIADKLAAYDDLIDNNRHRMALLEDAARQLYREWFVRLRFPGYEKSQLINGIPEGWLRTTLGAIVTLQYGKSLKAQDRKPGTVPVFGSSGRVGNHSEPLVNGPGIVVGRKGSVGSVFWSSDGFYPIDTTYYISPEKSNLFLFHALKEMHLISTDAAVPGLNRSFAHSRELVIPRENILRRFLEFADSTYAQIQLLSRQTALLREARDLLLPRLMRGELRP